MVDAATSLEHRALQFSAAARLTAYPEQQPGADSPLAARFAATPLDELRAEYLALFDAGNARCPVHETEYGRMRGMAKGNELADIAGFYTAFGLQLSDAPEAREMLDHVAVELEFYAVLLARQALLQDEGDAEGLAVVEDARRKFLADHLGRLAPAIATQPALERSALYRDAFVWCGELVREECAALQVTPAPLDFFAKEAEADEVCCGAPASFGATKVVPPGAPAPQS